MFSGKLNRQNLFLHGRHSEETRAAMWSCRTHKLLPTAAALAGMLLLWMPGSAVADEVLQWRQIVGIIQGGNSVGTGTGQVTGGGQPWHTRSGSAAVDLSNGQLQFQVQGAGARGRQCRRDARSCDPSQRDPGV
jgi:hypothetical protein